MMAGHQADLDAIERGEVPEQDEGDDDDTVDEALREAAAHARIALDWHLKSTGVRPWNVRDDAQLERVCRVLQARGGPHWQAIADHVREHRGEVIPPSPKHGTPGWTEEDNEAYIGMLEAFGRGQRGLDDWLAPRPIGR